MDGDCVNVMIDHQIRFGSAEIYSVLDNSFPQISDSLCVGQRRPYDADESVILFVLMMPGNQFTPKLINDIRVAIKKELSARHVPKYIFETPEIPVSCHFSLTPLSTIINLPLILVVYHL